MSIPFTQYLRPNGDMKQVEIERPSDIEKLAQDIMATGHCFECEALSTGMVSLTISDGERDVDGELVRNGPDVPPAVDRLIERFHPILFGDQDGE